MCQNNK
jgi:DNA replication licensing factor MCM2